jgi:hypothetical protein
MSDPSKAYCSCMEDVKARLKLVRSITQGHSPLGNEGLDGEVVCLLIRRILEQIAFGSLLAHRETYEAVHKDVERVWNAKRLIERLEKAHPDFYPKPVRVSPWRPLGVLNLDEVKRGYLTKEDFVFLYDTASDGVHTWNPFKSVERVLNFRISVSQWVQRIERLLDMHWVQFAGSPDVWLVQMDHPDDNRVHVFTAPAVAPEDAPAGVAIPPKANLIVQTNGVVVTLRFDRWPEA